VPAETVDLSNPLFLVGKNGAGKSNLVDAFAFLSECMTQPIQAAFDKRGGISAVRYRPGPKSFPGHFGLRAEFGQAGCGFQGSYAFELRALPNYGFEVAREQCIVRPTDQPGMHFDRKRSEFHTNVLGIQPSVDPQALALPVVGGSSAFAPALKLLSSLRVYSIEPTRVRELQDPDSGQSLKSDGSNVASVLKNLPQNGEGLGLERLCEILTTIVPGTTAIRTKKHGKKLSLEFTQDWGRRKHVSFEAFAMSDGTLRALGILTAIWQRPIPAVVVIEEPESTIHPEALGAILDVIRIAASRTQVILTTHSPEVLDAQWLEPTNVRVVTWERGVTRVLPLGTAPVQAIQRHLMGAGELFRSNALEPEESQSPVEGAVQDADLFTD
jgi:predicted ATPase